MDEKKPQASRGRNTAEAQDDSVEPATRKASKGTKETMANTEPVRPVEDRSKRNRKPAVEDEPSSLFGRISGLTSSAYRFAKKTTGGSIRVGKALMKSQDQLRLMLAAGESLRDLREVAGLTISEMSEALNLKDKSILEAVENGTATLSFELILRLSALLARNDPIPFVLRYTRTYSPEIWRVLHDWGLGRIPLQFERERQFINIYRRKDAARELSDEGFKKVLNFTRNAFDMALHFIAEQENVDLESVEELTPEEAVAEEIKKAKEQPRERNGRDKKRERDEEESED